VFTETYKTLPHISPFDALVGIYQNMAPEPHNIPDRDNTEWSFTHTVPPEDGKQGFESLFEQGPDCIIHSIAFISPEGRRPTALGNLDPQSNDYSPPSLPNTPTFVLNNVDTLFQPVDQQIKAQEPPATQDFHRPIADTQREIEERIAAAPTTTDANGFIIALCDDDDNKWLGGGDLRQRGKKMISTNGRPIGHTLPRYAHAYCPIYLVAHRHLPPQLQQEFNDHPTSCLMLFYADSGTITSRTNLMNKK
jgi:hypothetical protein